MILGDAKDLPDPVEFENPLGSPVFLFTFKDVFTRERGPTIIVPPHQAVVINLPIAGFRVANGAEAVQEFV